MLTIKEFAARSGCKPHNVLHGIKEGRIRATRFGDQWAIPDEELDSTLWINRRASFPTKEERAAMDRNLDERRATRQG